MARVRRTKKQLRMADAKAEKLSREALNRGDLIPGRLYLTNYDAKFKNIKNKDGSFKLPLWDKRPLLLILKSFTLKGTAYILGLNLNHPRYRGVKLKKMFEYILKEYLKKQDDVLTKSKNKTPILNQKKFINIDYDKVLVSDAFYKLRFGVRLYIKSRFTMVRPLPIKHYEIVGTTKATEALRMNMIKNS